MRVTKTIREYIEEQVYNKARQSAKLVELEKKKDEAVKNFLEDKKRAEEACQTYVDQLVNRYQMDVDVRHKPCVNFLFCYDSHLPEVKEYNKARSEINDKARQIALDIIVEMEMGGTKAELMDKLNALEF